MDLLEQGLCESHTKVLYESMIEPEESKVDTITHHHHHHHYHRQHHHLTGTAEGEGLLLLGFIF